MALSRFYKFVLSKDRLKLYLVMVDAAARGLDSPETVQKKADELGIMPAMIDRDAVAKVYSELLAPQEMLVGEGKAPVMPVPGKVEFYVDISEGPRFIPEEQDGKVDFRNATQLALIETGQKLARIIPPTPGRPGMDLMGTIIPPPEAKEGHLIAGPNVREERGIFYATAEGRIELSDDTLQVSRVFEVKGDVCYDTGNIDFPGSVSIKGDVKEGFSVRAGGDLEIHGVVEDCQVTAGGSMVLHGGVTGKSKTHLKAGKGISARFVHNATLETAGDILVNGEVLNSYLGSLQKVTLKKGGIAGGRTIALLGVEADTLGSPSGVRTEIRIGESYELEKMRSAVEMAVKRGLALQDRGIAYLKAGTIPSDQMEKAASEVVELGTLLKQANALYAVYLKKEQEQVAPDCQIVVHRCINADTILTAPGVTSEILEPINRQAVAKPDLNTGRMQIT